MMKKHTTKITAKSIESSGLPSDYKKAIAEYIWNGFDAKATEIQIKFRQDDFGNLSTLSIEDNGTGISLEDIDNTFGNFMVSQKVRSHSDAHFIKGKKGKGRFSFFIFSSAAKWHTKYENSTRKILEYDIFIDKSSPEFVTDNNKASKNKSTGTIVVFESFHDLTPDLLEDSDFRIFLSNEFGWFLFLHRDFGYNIKINGEELSYRNVIKDWCEYDVNIEGFNFKINYIEWLYKFGDRFYNYYLDSKKQIRFSQPTSFNHHSEFYHSVYIESSFFDEFASNESAENLFGLTHKNSIVFKKLNREIKEFLEDRLKDILRGGKAQELINSFYEKKIFPAFKNNAIDQIRREDLENVVKELYYVEPKLFKNLSDTQSKTVIGFLTLLLDTDRRDSVLEIIENVVTLSDRERDELADVLKRTKLSQVTAFIKLFEDRFRTVELLKTLIFDLTKFTNERDHIQKVIENNYWLFGEQYHLVSADKNFETLLNNYLHFLEQNNKKPEITKLEKSEKLRRPDIFICRQIDLLNPGSEDLIEENIIVELKRPNVVIGNEQFRQIEDYLRFISNEPRYSSDLRKWKFILVGRTLDPYIPSLYKNQELRNKKFLVQAIDNFEIYIMKWDDLFTTFNLKHKHIIDKLDFKDAVLDELAEKGIILNRETSDSVTQKVISIAKSS